MTDTFAAVLTTICDSTTDELTRERLYDRPFTHDHILSDSTISAFMNLRRADQLPRPTSAFLCNLPTETGLKRRENTVSTLLMVTGALATVDTTRQKHVAWLVANGETNRILLKALVIHLYGPTLTVIRRHLLLTRRACSRMARVGATMSTREALI